MSSRPDSPNHNNEDNGETKGNSDAISVSDNIPVAKAVLATTSENKNSDIPLAPESIEYITPPNSIHLSSPNGLDFTRLAKLYDQGFELAGAAKDADEKLQDYELSAGLWSQAVDTFVHAAAVEPDQRKVALLEQQVSQFLNKLSTLKQKAQAQQAEAARVRNKAGEEMRSQLASAQFFLEQAMLADEQQTKDGSSGCNNNEDKEAPLALYEKAAGLYLKLSRLDVVSEKARSSYLQRTSDILDRMEILKKIQNGESSTGGNNGNGEEKTISGSNSPISPAKAGGGNRFSGVSGRKGGSGGSGGRRGGDSGGGGGGGGGGGSGGSRNRLSESEKKVLASSSRINGRLYFPWLGQIDRGERFTSPTPFVDKDGLLKLSAKQRKHLKNWLRPSEFMDSPTMIQLVSPYTIRQELVTDCSFVSSLCIASSYERRSGKQLITSIIYPQNRNGVPVYNPCGKYMVKLWLNGVARKVIVDDRLPIGRRSDGSPRMLGSYTTSRNELWVSIIEKAYMKIHGGYDFPGSNSGIDLYALTGWIPEGFHFNDKNFQKHRTWQRLVNAHKYGDCLVTVATGEMSDSRASELGLVPTHAYAVLDVREACGVRMVLVKNPWSHMRWKGKYSPEDTRSWTKEMRKALRYDQLSAMQRDNGIFWIDYQSLCDSFNGLYLNWNRDLFQHHTSHHKFWPGNDSGPKNDSYNVGYNPQYALTVKALPSKNKNLAKSRQSSAVWILLSRHVVNKHLETTDDHSKVKPQYLTLHVYKRSDGQGSQLSSRMFYPQKPFMSKPYSNNPHTLIRFDVPPGETITYTLVVSQYEKERDLSYTLEVFSMASFRLTPLSRTLGGSEIRLDGSWTQIQNNGQSGTAGGSPRHVTFMNNRQYRLRLEKGSKGLRLRLRAPKELHVNIRMFDSGGQLVDDVAAEGVTEIMTSGDYRPGFCYAETRKILPPGEYTIIPSTWEPNQIGPFFLYVETSHPVGTTYCSVRKMLPEGSGKLCLKVFGEWSYTNGTAVGCQNYGNYSKNPAHRLKLTKASHVMIRLQLIQDGNSQSISTCVVVTDSQNKVVSKTNNGVYTNKICGVKTTEVTLEQGDYTMVPSTFKPSQCRYILLVYVSDRDARLI